MRVELGPDEVVVEPQDRIALLGAPLVVAEYHHRDAGPLPASDGAHLAHGNSECAVASEADTGRIRIADLGADNGGEAIPTRPEQSRGQILPPRFERRIGVADGAIVADVAGDDGVPGKRGLDRTPSLPRRHSVGFPLA